MATMRYEFYNTNIESSYICRLKGLIFFLRILVTYLKAPGCIAIAGIYKNQGLMQFIYLKVM